MSLRIAPTLRTAALRRAAPRVAAPMLRRGNASAAGGQGQQQQQHNQGKQGGGSKLPLILAALAAGGGAYYYFAEMKPADNAQAIKTHSKADYEKVYKDIADTLEKEGYDDGSLAPVVLRLAWHASGTYNKDDKTGGSNYATMRFPAESGHGANAGLNVARDYLEKIHQKYPWISYGDLWTLAGVVAVQEAGGPVIPWRPGRVDGLEVNQTPDGRLPDASQGAPHIRDVFGRMGFNDQETVALIGAHALGRCHTDRSGYEGPWTYSPTSWSNELYRLMLDKGQKWHFKKWKGPQQFENNDKQLMMLPTDMVLISDKGFRPWVEKYANDEDAFNKDFAKAFSTLIELGVPQDNFKTKEGWSMGQEDN